ncbi:hypothetical protein Tco_1090834 [Tanacetum coccineum]|uniref:Reverse transcriptase domain-containing protein n=1 Tax=Tanacetum coccineum TaxID=301880 RepID=A0ABQ5I5K3_9ASTR
MDRMSTPTQFWNGSDGYAYPVLEWIGWVTANGGNGGNGGNGRNKGCSYKGFKACNPKDGCSKNQKVKYAASAFVNKALTWWKHQVQARGREATIETEFWNHKMVGANHAGYTDWFHKLAKLVPHLVTPESSRIKRAGILTNEAVNYGTLTKGNEKRKGVDESSKSGGSWKENKKAKVGIGFVATASPRNKFVGSYPKCAKCYAYHPENGA